MIKKILFLDDGKPEQFFQDLQSAAQSNNVEVKSVRSKSLVMYWSGNTGKMRVFANNEELDLQQYYILPRRSGLEARPIIGLLFLYAKLNKIAHDEKWRERYARVGKPWELIMLSYHGIPYPESFICTRSGFEANKKEILSRIIFPVVLKAEGDKGQAVWKIDSQDELDMRIGMLDTPFLIQKYIPNLFDIRVLVYKGKVLWAIKRSSTDGFYNNTSRGGDREVIEISNTEAELAIKAAHAVKIDLAGVDLVRTEDGIYVFEVNSAPSLDQTSQFLGVNVGQEIINNLFKN